MATFTNNRDGKTIESTLTHEEAWKRFLEIHGANKDHWLMYWVHKYAQDANPVVSQNRAISFLADSFLLAIGYGLKRPMIRVHYRDQRFKFYLSAKGTICLKSGKLVTITHTLGQGDHPPVYTHDPVGDEFYVGCLLRGAFLPASLGGWRDTDVRQQRQYTNRQDRPLTPTEGEFLSKLQENPIEFLAQCSKDMNRCMFCPQPLEDPRSKAVGCGETCAKRWGVAWGLKTETEKAPSFARDYDNQAQGLCATIKDKPQFETAWNVLGDWLEEHGLPRCQVPAKGVVLPRNDSTNDKTTMSPAPVPVKAPEPVVAPTITSWNASTVHMDYDSETKTLSVNASDLKLSKRRESDWPMRINTNSHLTGAVKGFFRAGMSHADNGAILSVDYVCGDLTLRIFND